MLQLLLDEHISPKVSAEIRRRDPTLTVHAMSEWESGAFLGQQDPVCLREAAAQSLTLVTYDLRTIPPLLKIWAEEGQTHGGVILVDGKTIALGDIGGLTSALLVWQRKDENGIGQIASPFCGDSLYSAVSGRFHIRHKSDRSSMLRMNPCRSSCSRRRLSRNT